MFILSLLFVLFSSYFFTCCFFQEQVKKIEGVIYFFLISFAQIVLNFEILSVFSKISEVNFILVNFLFLIFSLIFWIKNKKQVFCIDLNSSLEKVIRIIKKDKLLYIASVFFIVFILAQVVLALFLPCSFGDALSYYFPRCTTWIQQGNLNHFLTLDTRELIMPINIDLLYLWVMLFTKSIKGVAVFSFLGFVLAIISLYNLSKEIGCSTRRSLWAIFVFSSFALIGLEIHTPISDLFVGALLLTSLYLFLLNCKYNKINSLYFSSLAIALAIGAKTTAIMALPVLMFLCCVIALLYDKERKYKKYVLFLLFLIANFFIFSAFNYILNYLHYGDFISTKEQYLLHCFRGGFKSWLCSFVKYIFVFFDTSGIVDIFNFSKIIVALQNFVLFLIGENINSYTSAYFFRFFIFDSNLTIVSSFLGILGIFAFIPSFFISIKRYSKNKKSKKVVLLSSFSFSLLLLLVILSFSMVYSGYNVRYLLTFVVLSSPIIVYSYSKKKNVWKKVIVIFMFVYLVYFPLKFTSSFIFKPQNIQCEEQQIYEYIKNINPRRIAGIIDQGNIPLYEIEKLKLNGVHYDKLLSENIEIYDLKQYDYIITNRFDTTSTNIVDFKNRMTTNKINYSKCSYWDSNMKEVFFDGKEQPVMVLCETPYRYFSLKGFVEDKDIYLRNYVILKKKTRE